MARIQVLHELFRITERRDGCVYKTQYIRDVWADPDAKPPEDHMYVAKPSSFTGPTIWRVTP